MKMAATSADIHIPTTRNLLLSLIQKRFLTVTTSSSAATLNSPSSPVPTSCSSFKVQYLIEACGLSVQSALSVSQKLQLDEANIQKSQTVLRFFKARGFSNSHIAEMITKWPVVLHCKVEDNLKPKFDFFVKNGFVGQLLPELIASDPLLLRRKLDSHIKPCFEFLQPFLDSNERFIAVMKRAPWLYSFSFWSSLRPNIDFLIKEGLPVDKVKKLIILQPRTLQLMPERVVVAVNAIKDLGIDIKAPVFIHALRVMTQMTESTWKKKIEVLKRFDWTEEEVLLAFKKCPHFLACSEKKIASSVDFLLNTIKVGKQTIVRRPLLLMYSIDRRIRPRHAVLKALESKNLIKGDNKITTLLDMSDKRFLEKYVAKFVDRVPNLLQIYGCEGEAERTDSWRQTS